MVSNNLVSLQTLLRVNNDDKIVGAIEMEEEWKSVYEEQSAG